MHDTPVGPTIEWVNHASFVTSVGPVRLICDPWLEGAAFNNGWELLAPTTLGYDDFASITHLWISHQHPDHFAPTNLQRIPLAVRRRLKVLYRMDKDKLVVSWLRSNGFGDVTELETDRWISLAPGVDCMCGVHNDDSWLAVRSSWGTLLNLNDAVLKRASDITRIAELVGRVDVLFTQFSYAQWIGNPEDTALRRRESAEKVDRIRLQDRILQPRTIVPFASFVYFCNSENFFLNDGMNAVADVASVIETDLGKRAAVLYPGDKWNVDDISEWRPAAQRYASHLREKLDHGPTLEPRRTSRDDVERQIGGFIVRLVKKNPAVRALVRERATIFITDFEQAYQLSANGFTTVPVSARECDIITSGENLVYAFRTPWGADTLHVNGRFRSYTGSHETFFRLVNQLQHYNRTPVNAAWVFQQCRRVVRGAMRRLARVGVGQ